MCEIEISKNPAINWGAKYNGILPGAGPSAALGTGLGANRNGGVAKIGYIRYLSCC